MRPASSGPTFRPRAAKKRSPCSLPRRRYPKAGSHFYYRRPSPGFHPHVYAFENRDRYDAALINPLAHFIRSGKPEGPWKSEVILPAGHDGDTAPTPAMKVGLHVHFHYPELCAELLALISSNRSRCDLLLTTNSAQKARVLEKETAGYQRGNVEIMTIPNRGRDIGAFLTGLGEASCGDTTCSDTCIPSAACSSPIIRSESDGDISSGQI